MTTHPDLEAYVLGHHDETDRAAVEAHIAGCDECMAEVGREARLELLLHAAGAEDAFVAVVQPPRRRRWPVVAAAAVTVAAAAAAALALWSSGTEPERRTSAPATVPTGGRPTTRPAWAAGVKPETARCSETESDLTCAASAFGDSREQAEAAAVDIARETLFELAVSRGDEAISAQRPLYSAVRSAALRAPHPEATRRTRHAVASRTLLGRRDGWYWEEYEKLDGRGTEFLVYVRFTATADDIADYLSGYAIRTSDTAELVRSLPGVRWALDPGDDMAWFVHRPGRLAELGIRAGDILLMDQRLRASRMRGLVETDRLRVWRPGLTAPVLPSKLR